MPSSLELAIGLTLYADNFLRSIAESTKKTLELKNNLFSLNGVRFVDEGGEFKKLTREIQRTQRGFERLKAVIKKTFDPNNLNSFAEKLEDITVKTGAVGGAITLGFKSVIADTADFERGLAEASTLVKIDFEKFKKLYSNQLLEISVELGQDQSTVTKAFYDAISAGFSPQKALEVIKTAGKAAIAGVSDISTANNALITVVKSWGIGLKQASDYIFKAVAKGRTTFREIARDIGGVAATVASAGVKFNEFSAILAAATAKGLDTGQTMTSIREIVNSLIAPTSQAQKAFQQLGITVNKETLKQKGLVGTLKEITDAMKRAGLTEAEQAQMLSQIFGSVEAQKVVNMFVADPKTFIRTLKDFQSVSGETDKAFKKMSQSAWFTFSRLSQAASSLKISFGLLLLPSVRFLADGLTTLSLSLKNLVEHHKTLSKVIGFTVGGFGLLLSAIAGTAAASALTLKALSFLGEGLSIVRKTAAGAYAKLYELLKVEKLLNQISYRGGFLNFVQFELLKTKYRLLELKSTITEAVKAQLLWAKTNLLSVSGLRRLALSLKTELVGALKAAAAGFRTLAAATLTSPIFWIGAAIAGTAFLIYKFWKPIKHFFEGFFKGLADSFSFLSPVFSGVAKGISLIGSLVKPLGDFISSIVKPVEDSGKATREWGFAVGHLVGEVFKLPLVPILALIEGFKLLKKAIGWAVAGWHKLKGTLSVPIAFPSPFGFLFVEWKKVYRFLSSINLFAVGSKIFSTLIEGLKSKAAELYNTVKGTLSKVRNLLPFSPAKEGPLSDLHKTGLRLVKTIAEGIKGDPLLKEIAGILSRAKSLFLNTLPLGFSLSPLSLAATVTPGKPISVFPGIRKPVPATYNINLNVSVNGKTDRQTAVEIAKAVEPVIRKVLREHQRKEMRVNYGIGDSYNRP